MCKSKYNKNKINQRYKTRYKKENKIRTSFCKTCLFIYEYFYRKFFSVEHVITQFIVFVEPSRIPEKL